MVTHAYFIYRSPWFTTMNYVTKQYQGSTNYVVISAVNAMFSGPETYIFPASSNGEVIDWCELDGSYKGGLDHVQALRQAGYGIRPAGE
jgi:hypothetical protein